MELYFNFKNKTNFMYNFTFYDGSYLLPTRLDLWRHLTAMSLGGYTHWKDCLKGKVPPQKWAAPSGGRLDVKQVQGEMCFPAACLDSLLVSHLLCSYSGCHALVTASLTFQHGLKISPLQEAARLPPWDWCCWDSQPPALSSFQILSLRSVKKVIVGLPSSYHMSI